MARKAGIYLIAGSLMYFSALTGGEEKPVTGPGAPAAPAAEKPPAVTAGKPAASPAAPKPQAAAEAKPAASAARPVSEGEPVLATLKGMVAVQMKQGASYYRGRTIYGVKSPASDDQILVLTIPGMGEIRIPQSAVERITPVAPLGEAAPAVPATAGSRTIRTTHLILLNNGQKIQGSLVPSAESEPLALEINALGKVWIPRNRIAKVEESPGEIVFPEPASEALPADAQPEAAGEHPTQPESAEAKTEPVRPSISADLKSRIEECVYNLTRWRHRNRVWAERQLVAIGAPAIPFLRSLVNDPFDLTRRACVRIVRDAGDPEGIPIAIEGLLDEDGYVREIAAEALRGITRKDFGYRPYDSLQRRLDAHGRWRDWWAQQTEPRP